MNNAVSLLWLAAVLVAIPVVLWLLKRTPMMRGQHAPGAPRLVASLPLSPQQRVVTVEVGLGEEREWLVLGVGPQGITPLHTMPAGLEALMADANTMPPFSIPGVKDLLATTKQPAARPASRTAQRPSARAMPKHPGADPAAAASAKALTRSSGTQATFSQLLQRLRTPLSSTAKRGPGKPPNESKPGNHGR